MKKILIITILSFLLVACGKKADPEYKETKIDKIQSIII